MSAEERLHSFRISDTVQFDRYLYVCITGVDLSRTGPNWGQKRGHFDKWPHRRLQPKLARRFRIIYPCVPIKAFIGHFSRFDAIEIRI